MPSTLTPAQQSAISHTSGPLLIIAGPGAVPLRVRRSVGKTRVIVEKCVHLIKEAGKKPENLLVTTFTNKATEELYDRLYANLGDDAQRITISTIHSFCKTLISSFFGQDQGGKFRQVFLYLAGERKKFKGLNAEAIL